MNTQGHGYARTMKYIVAVFAQLTLSGSEFQRVGAAIVKDPDTVFVLNLGIKKNTRILHPVFSLGMRSEGKYDGDIGESTW